MLNKSYEKLLSVAAIGGQLVALFPFGVVFCALGAGKYELRFYLLIFVAWLAFNLIGMLFGKIANNSGSGKNSAVIVVSKLSVILPAVIFIVVVQLCGFTPASYLYVLSAGIIAYFGGYSGVERGYTGKFSFGWIILYFIAALAAAVLLYISKNPELISSGTRQLCVGFGVMIVLSALLLNQSTIDLRTKQRAAGKPLLPGGLRGFNATIVLVMSLVAVGIFLFAKPISEGLWVLTKLVAAGVFFLIDAFNEWYWGDDLDFTPSGQGDMNIFPENNEQNDFAGIIMVTLIIGAIVILFIFRKPIIEAIKGLFAPLAKKTDSKEDLPYYDELSASSAKPMSKRAKKKQRREMLKAYENETEPIAKYRRGYGLFLTELADTPKPPKPSDTTTVHADKGSEEFSDFSDNIERQKAVYNRVRYGESVPSAEELQEQEKLISEINKGDTK